MCRLLHYFSLYLCQLPSVSLRCWAYPSKWSWGVSSLRTSQRLSAKYTHDLLPLAALLRVSLKVFESWTRKITLRVCSRTPQVSPTVGQLIIIRWRPRFGGPGLVINSLDDSTYGALESFVVLRRPARLRSGTEQMNCITYVSATESVRGTFAPVKLAIHCINNKLLTLTRPLLLQQVYRPSWMDPGVR